MIGAALLAKKAVEKGLASKPWVKTSLAPGSKVVTDYLIESGLMRYLEILRFHLVGYGCTTCIGNSGPLPPPVADAVQLHDLVTVAVLSGNRNFEGRVHANVRANYLASPPLVVAYSLLGTVTQDITTVSLGTGNDGKPLANNPLLDVRVRQALSLAVDRKAIVDRILQGAATVANQWMPADTYGYNPDVKNIAYDPAQAKKLLADAGFPQGFNLVMHVPNDRYPQGPETAQAVAQFWSRIGVKTKVEVVPWSVYSGRANKNDYAMSMLAWGNGTGEASYALVNVLATVDTKKGLGASNWGHYSNPAYDDMVKRSYDERDLAAHIEKVLGFNRGGHAVLLRLRGSVESGSRSAMGDHSGWKLIARVTFCHFSTSSASQACSSSEVRYQGSSPMLAKDCLISILESAFSMAPFRREASAWQTSLSCCGLTASSTMSSAESCSGRVVELVTPKSWLSSASFVVLASTT